MLFTTTTGAADARTQRAYRTTSPRAATPRTSRPHEGGRLSGRRTRGVHDAAARHGRLAQADRWRRHDAVGEPERPRLERRRHRRARVLDQRTTSRIAGSHTVTDAPARSSWSTRCTTRRGWPARASAAPASTTATGASTGVSEATATRSSTPPRADGSDRRELTRLGKWEVYDVSLSNDGRASSFTRARSRRSIALVRMPIDGGARVTLTTARAGTRWCCRPTSR